MAEEIIFDSWTSLSFKRSMGNRRDHGKNWMVPTWVGDHARRLQAYRILQSYIDNAARFWLSTDDSEVRDQHREYGDASLIVETIRAALLGDQQEVVTDGAEEFDTSTGATNSAEAQLASEFQEWAAGWAADERLPLKVIEAERNSVGMGDGVYTLGYNTDKARVRLRVFDPGFYFPVLDDGAEDDYPSKVHIAWELLPIEGDTKMRVRRITWEMQDVPESRTLSWNDQPTDRICFMSDGTWTFDKGGPMTIEDFSEASVEWAKIEIDGEEVDFHDIDLGVDFVPVVHVPNTVSLQNHFGKSCLSSILQILDDLANADTDLQASSATTGKPPIALGGATLGSTKPSYKPGEVWEVGDGRATMIDTSKALDALMAYVRFLLTRLSVNGRLPESLLGRIKPSDVPSGIALALSFGPLTTMVEEMRLVRDEKYPLLFKFAWRMSVASDQEGVPAEFHDTRLSFGSYLPSDVAAAVSLVSTLLSARAISLETAVAVLIEAGLPVDDAAEEVRRIETRDFLGAGQLLDATGDEGVVFDYLDLKQTAPAGPVQPPPTPVPSPPVNPVIPPQGGNVQ